MAYRDKFHDEQGYSFFMRQLDKLVNPAWSGMGNMDDLLMLIGGVAPALHSPTPTARGCAPLTTRYNPLPGTTQGGVKQPGVTKSPWTTIMNVVIHIARPPQPS